MTRVNCSSLKSKNFMKYDRKNAVFNQNKILQFFITGTNN